MKQAERFASAHGWELSCNMEFNKAAYVPYSLYGGGSEPIEMQVWFCEDMMVICWSDTDHPERIMGHPTHTPRDVKEGISTPGLRSLIHSSSCCFSMTRGIETKEDFLFSLVFEKGQTLDLEATSIKAKENAVLQFTGLLRTIVPIAQKHQELFVPSLASMISKEARRAEKVKLEATGVLARRQKQEARKRGGESILAKYSHLKKGKDAYVRI